MDLHVVVNHAIEHLRSPHLDDGALHRVLLDGFANVVRDFRGAASFLLDLGQRAFDHAHGAVDHRLAHVDAHRHIGQLLFDEPEIGDALAESLALLGIADGAGQRVARSAHTSRAQLEAPQVQNVESDGVPLADLAQHVLHRHLAVA